MLEFGGFNWWAILVATVVAFVLGGLWYGPIFGKAWLGVCAAERKELGLIGI